MEIREAVELLDREYPDWEYLVDPEVLNNSSGRKDVLGQVYGKSYRGQIELGLSSDQRESLGFDGDEGSWMKVISQRIKEKGPRAHQLSLFD